MVFQLEAKHIGIYTYNPALDTFCERPSIRFDLDYRSEIESILLTHFGKILFVESRRWSFNGRW